VSNESVNYWKLATIGIVLVGATAAATLMITGGGSETGQPQLPASEAALATATEAGEKAASVPARSREERPNRNTSAGVPPPSRAAYPVQAPPPAYPSQSVMQACNQYANEQVNSKTEEVLTNAALGAAIGAAIGAAGGRSQAAGAGPGKERRSAG
jgi:hypothetical protein